MNEKETKSSIFHRPKVLKTIKVEGRNIFVPSSYYFALYDDDSYSLYDGETFKYLCGNKKLNFGSMIRSAKETCKFQNPEPLGRKRYVFYSAINDYKTIEQEQADAISNALGIDPHYLSSMYFYDPDDPKDEEIWENYKKIRKLFVDKCEKLGIDHETDSTKIIISAIETIDKNFDERFEQYKNDLSFCHSPSAIDEEYRKQTAEATTEFDFLRIASNFSSTKQEMTDFPAAFFDLSDKAVIALNNNKKTDYELLQKYTEFLIALPTCCQIISQLDRCSKKATKQKQRIKLEKFYNNPEFIAELKELIDHDPEQVTYHYHAAVGQEEAEKILQQGLYMYSERVDSTTFPEFSTNEILQYGYGNDFATFEDYIIVIAQPKGENIVRQLTEEERQQVSIMPRRMALTSKPTHVINPEYIVGYIDKKNCQVVNNPSFTSDNTDNIGGKNEK